MLVRSWPVGAGIPAAATARNRVWLSGKSSTSSSRMRQPVELGGEAGGDRRGPGLGMLADDAGGVGGGRGGDELDVGQLLGEGPPALGEGDGIGEDPAHGRQVGAGGGHQVQVDVEDDLALDEEVDVEDEGVEGVADHAVDGVLDRHETDVDLAAGDRVEDVADRRARFERGGRVVGLGEQRLLGEGTDGPEEGHRGHRTGHSGAG